MPQKIPGLFQPAQHKTQTGPIYVVPGLPGSTTYICTSYPSHEQNWLSHSLVDTQRTTVESAEARNGSLRMARTRGVGLFRMDSLCPYLHVISMHARTSVALTCPSATRLSLSTGIMPAWAMSAGEVLQEELAAAACFYCCLLLLQVVLLLHKGTHTRCRVPERIASQRQCCLKRARRTKSGLRPSRGKLGQSKASGKFSANRKQLSNLISTVFSSTIICFPNMTNFARSNKKC